MFRAKAHENSGFFIFDENIFLHPRQIGSASYASFYINKLTIGIAKVPLIIDGIDYRMSKDLNSSFEEIDENRFQLD
ncbi:MAG: endonuclease V [Sporosarcina sp.]